MLAPGSNPGSRASWTSSTCDLPDLSGLERPDRSHYSWISVLEFDGQPLPEGYSLETASLLLREAWAVIDVVERDGVRCNRIVQLLPAWLTGALDRARRRSTESQLPVAVLQAAGEPPGESLVVMRLRDFVAWHGELPAGPRPPREP